MPADLMGKKWRFKCDCTFKINIIGVVRGWEQVGSEFIYKVDTGTKVIRLGSNHGGLKVGRP